jgi:hypothetical protein
MAVQTPRSAALARPGVRARPAYIGARAGTSLRLDGGRPNSDEAALRVCEAYRRIAPKTLARAVAALGAG